ncbi:hypothetical protein GALL_147360 [mine drainage metagenome]|uniref:Uncharacterized protein n=1 Tax=mine drainage metagenome TaxID=410659 RepID=A0A1J5SGP3_9ZZZZ
MLNMDSGAGSRRTVVQAANIKVPDKSNKRVVFIIGQPVADINHSCELLLQYFKQICDFPCSLQCFSADPEGIFCT